MGKRRSIDSDMRLSETLSKMSYRQRDLWHGLIATGDDQGRLPGNAAAIRALVWPYDDISLVDIENDLRHLASNDIGVVMIYGIGGKDYIQIINWWKYQKSQWAAPSKYPSPEGWLDRVRVTGKGKKIVAQNWDTPGGFCFSLDDNVNDKDNVNDNPLSAALNKGSDKGADKPLSGVEATTYRTLLTAFTNKSRLPIFGNLKPRDNDALLKMVKAGCQPSDIESAIDYSTSNGLQIIGPASILNGAMIAMANRKRSAETPQEVWAEEHY